MMDEWDTLKFRLMLWPAVQGSATLDPSALVSASPIQRLTTCSDAPSAASYGADTVAGAGGSLGFAGVEIGADAEAPTALQQHRMVMQLIGGKSSSQVMSRCRRGVGADVEWVQVWGRCQCGAGMDVE